MQQYFRVKQQQLSSLADLPVCEHPGLVGGHREELQRIYLREVLPKRFEVGRGMVYGVAHRSREADVVIWDSHNFPSLPMLDHSFFFAESVRAVLESKSVWSQAEFVDVLDKAEAVRDIISIYRPSVVSELEMLELEVAALKEGREHDGIFRSEPRIGTAAIFLRGGAQALVEKTIDAQAVEDADDRWPDLILLLEPGRLVVKEYSDQDGTLSFYDLQDDALLAFTNGLLTLLNDRSVQTEGPLFLSQYAGEVGRKEPFLVLDFPLHRPAPFRIPLWR